MSAAVLLINRKDASIIDVREAQEFKAGHIPNARNFPMAQLKERKKELEKLKSKPILLVCQTGNRSTQAYSDFHEGGFCRGSDLGRRYGVMAAGGHAGGEGLGDEQGEDVCDRLLPVLHDGRAPAARQGCR